MTLSLFLSLTISKLQPVLPLSVCGQEVASVEMGHMFSIGSKKAFLASLDLYDLKSFCRRYVYGRSWKAENEPVDRLQDKKFCSLQPAKATEDPYMVAILIALAQEQRPS